MSIFVRTTSPSPVRSPRALAGSVLALLCLFCAPAFAQTTVQGVVTGFWPASAGPYLIIDNCTVPTGQVLEIEAGAVVLGAPGMGIVVDGQLIVDGSAAPVTFGPAIEGQPWSSSSRSP